MLRQIPEEDEAEARRTRAGRRVEACRARRARSRARLASRASSTRPPPRERSREGFARAGVGVRRAAGRRRRRGDARRRSPRLAAASGARREVADAFGRPRRRAGSLLPDGTAVVEAAEAIAARPRAARRSRARRAAASASCCSRRSTRPAPSSSSASAGRRRWTAARGCSRCWTRCPSRRASRATSTRRSARGAAAVRPAEGRDRRGRRELEARLAAMRSLPVRRCPAPAPPAGLGAALAALGAELVPGAPLVLDALGFDPRALRARRHGRGHGRPRRRAREGAAARSRAAAREAGVRCVVFGGRVERAAAGRGDGRAARATRPAPRDDLGRARPSALGQRASIACSCFASAWSSFQATVPLASTSGRKSQNVIPRQRSSVSAVTVAVRSQLGDQRDLAEVVAAAPSVRAPRRGPSRAPRRPRSRRSRRRARPRS